MCSPHRCGSRYVCVCVRKHSFAPTENDVMRVYNSFSGRNYVAVSTPPLWQQQPQRWRTKTFGFIEQQPIKIHLNLRYGVTIFCSFCCFTLKEHLTFNWRNTKFTFNLKEACQRKCNVISSNHSLFSVFVDGRSIWNKSVFFSQLENWSKSYRWHDAHLQLLSKVTNFFWPH